MDCVRGASQNPRSSWNWHGVYVTQTPSQATPLQNMTLLVEVAQTTPGVLMQAGGPLYVWHVFSAQWPLLISLQYVMVVSRRVRLVFCDRAEREERTMLFDLPLPDLQRYSKESSVDAGN